MSAICEPSRSPDLAPYAQCLACAETAKQRGIKTIGLLKRDGGVLKMLLDHAIIVPGAVADRIEEMHTKIIHTAIEVYERALFPECYE